MRPLLTGAAILVVGVLAAGCGSSTDPQTVSIDLPAPAPPAASADDGRWRRRRARGRRAAAKRPPSRSPPRSTPARRPSTRPRPPSRRSAKPWLALDVPKGSYPVIWVRRGQRIEMRTKPGGGELVTRAGKRTEFGSPTVLGRRQAGRASGRG